MIMFGFFVCVSIYGVSDYSKRIEYHINQVTSKWILTVKNQVDWKFVRFKAFYLYVFDFMLFSCLWVCFELYHRHLMTRSPQIKKSVNYANYLAVIT